MEKIYSKFQLDGLVISCTRYGNGHINETYLLVTSRPHLYILQKINSYVFHDAAGLMNNIIAVTDRISIFCKNSLHRHSRTYPD